MSGAGGDMDPGALSAALQADLLRYHEAYTETPQRPLGEIPARLLLARCIERLVDARGAAATVMRGALDLIEAGSPTMAAELLQWALERYEDRPEGASIQ